MKRAALLSFMLALTSSFLWADTPIAAVVPKQSIVVWISGKDPKSIQEVELAVLVELANHEIQGQRFSTLFPTGLPASSDEAIDKMRASGSGYLLVLRRRSAINWETPAKTKNLSSLRAFLAHRNQLLNPKYEVEADSSPIVVPNLYGNTEMEIVKGEGLLFDLAKEKLAWRGDTQIKSAKDLPQADYYKLVAQKVASSLAAAGFIPPGKK